MSKTTNYMREYASTFAGADIYAKLWMIFVSIPFVTVVIYALRILWGMANVALTSPSYFLAFFLGFAFTLAFIFLMVFMMAIVVMTFANGFEKARKSLSAAIVLSCVAAGLVLFELALLDGLGVDLVRSI